MVDDSDDLDNFTADEEEDAYAEFAGDDSNVVSESEVQPAAKVKAATAKATKKKTSGAAAAAAKKRRVASPSRSIDDAEEVEAEMLKAAIAVS